MQLALLAGHWNRIRPSIRAPSKYGIPTEHRLRPAVSQWRQRIPVTDSGDSALISTADYGDSTLISGTNRGSPHPSGVGRLPFVGVFAAGHRLPAEYADALPPVRIVVEADPSPRATVAKDSADQIHWEAPPAGASSPHLRQSGLLIHVLMTGRS